MAKRAEQAKFRHPCARFRPYYAKSRQAATEFVAAARRARRRWIARRAVFSVPNPIPMRECALFLAPCMVRRVVSQFEFSFGPPGQPKRSAPVPRRLDVLVSFWHFSPRTPECQSRAMSEAIVAALEVEKGKLADELSRVPAFRRYQMICNLIADYQGETESSVDSPPKADRASAPTQRRSGSKTAAVEEAAVAYFMKKGVRATSGDLLPVMAEAGIEIGGSVPSKSMASYLSNCRRLNNIKGLGYGLAEWGGSAGPRAERGLIDERPKENAPPSEEGGADAGGGSAPPEPQPSAAEHASKGGQPWFGKPPG